MRRLPAIFSAYYAKNIIARAEKACYNLRERCGDYDPLHPRITRLAEVSVG